MSGSPVFPEASIVVVDDSGANVLLLQRLLQSWGYHQITTITAPGTVLEVVAAIEPDLIMLDLHMPAPDGYALLPELTGPTAGDPPPPVLVLTADATRPTRDRALALGARDFLTKPLDPVEVRLRVSTLLDARCARLALRRAEAELALLGRS